MGIRQYRTVIPEGRTLNEVSPLSTPLSAQSKFQIQVQGGRVQTKLGTELNWANKDQNFRKAKMLAV